MLYLWKLIADCQCHPEFIIIIVFLSDEQFCIAVRKHEKEWINISIHGMLGDQLSDSSGLVHMKAFLMNITKRHAIIITSSIICALLLWI